MSETKKLKIVFAIVVLLSVIYLLFSVTKAAYESNINGNLDNEVAKWNIKINDIDITNTMIKEVKVGDIYWNNTHTKEGKVSPGSSGVMTLIVDPSDTDVAIKYDITYSDSSNSDKILTITSLNSTTELTKTADNKYTGILSLDDINAGIKPVITINIEWVNDEAMNERDSGDVDDALIELVFTAIQYNGEAIQWVNIVNIK